MLGSHTGLAALSGERDSHPISCLCICVCVRGGASCLPMGRSTELLTLASGAMYAVGAREGHGQMLEEMQSLEDKNRAIGGLRQSRWGMKAVHENLAGKPAG